MKKSTILFTLGCKLNQSETNEIASAFLNPNGLKALDEGNGDAKLVFVNTCAVTKKAEAKSRHAVSKLARENPNAIIVAAGCLAELNPSSLGEIPGVNHVVGTEERFSQLFWNQILNGEDQDLLPSGIENSNRITTDISTDRSRPFLKIQDGCDQNCTYCIIPRLRGSQRYSCKDEIIAQAVNLVSLGAKEIVLTGVRIGSWQDASTLPEMNLAMLTDELTKINGLERIRLGSVEPWELDEELLYNVVNNPKVCPHLHIPLQHTHDVILDSMGRPSVESALATIRNLKKSCPDAAVGADIIVGFPGETDAHFNSMLTELTSLPLTYLHTFGFSKRQGTPAEKMPHQVESKIIRKRVKLVKEIGADKISKFKTSQAGRIVTAIPDKPKPEAKFVMAVTENYLKIKIRNSNVYAGQPVKAIVRIGDSNELLGEVL